ncbi:unnamed protein product, partial [Mesorhabditis spiculigera]
MERCVFCGWTRKNAYASVRFFGVPKEPGLKRVQWLYAIGNREASGKHDRVCSVHFRSGKPSSDPSHEDFAPHLYLNKEAPPEFIHYLEKLAEVSDPALQKKPVQYKASVSVNDPKKLEYNKVTRPSILQKRKIQHEEPSSAAPQIDVDENGGEEEDQQPEAALPYHIAPVNIDGEARPMRLYPMQKDWLKQTGAVPGMKIIYRLSHPEKKAPRKQEFPGTRKREMVRIRMEDEHGNIIEERYVSESDARRMHEQMEMHQLDDAEQSIDVAEEVVETEN